MTHEQLITERPANSRTIYWFSQTIGPERGLETAIQALVHLPKELSIVLRGVWANGYRDHLYSLARSLNVDSRVHDRSPAPPEQMIAYAACHDIGLAIENASTVNRDICVTNKLFTFLSAGTPCILTDTLGQRPFGLELSKSTRLIPQNAPQAMASAALQLLNDHATRKRKPSG